MVLQVRVLLMLNEAIASFRILIPGHGIPGAMSVSMGMTLTRSDTGGKGLIFALLRLHDMLSEVFFCCNGVLRGVMAIETRQDGRNEGGGYT